MKIKPAQKNRLSDWKISKLGDVATISRGGSPRPIEFYVTSEEDGLNWLRIGDVVPGAKYIYKTSEKIKKEGLKKTTLVHEGDFILSNSMSFGRPYIMKTSACIHDGWLALMSIKTDLISKDFLYYLLSSNKIQGLFTSISAGSGVQNLKKETVSEVLVKLPPTDEQNRIVSVLETWDKAIEKLAKKIELKKNIKKGLMQRLLTGELRLPGFSEAWQAVKLGDVCDYKNGKSFENKVVENGKYQLITLNSLNINGGLKNENKTVDVNDKSLNRNDIIMILSDIAHGNFLGMTNVIPENDKYVLNQRVGALKPKKKLNSVFVSKLLNINQEYFKSHGHGSSQQNLSKGDIVKYKINLPTLDEQNAIENILTAADNEITLLKKKLSIIKDQKKYLLNNLITGAIRTPEKMPEPSHRDGTHD